MKKELEKPKSIFSQRLDEIMFLNGICNASLAKKVYVAETTISGYRTGRRTPDPERLTALCKAIPVSADYLLGLSDNAKISK